MLIYFDHSVMMDLSLTQQTESRVQERLHITARRLHSLIFTLCTEDSTLYVDCQFLNGENNKDYYASLLYATLSHNFTDHHIAWKSLEFKKMFLKKLYATQWSIYLIKNSVKTEQLWKNYYNLK